MYIYFNLWTFLSLDYTRKIIGKHLICSIVQLHTTITLEVCGKTKNEDDKSCGDIHNHSTHH